MSKIKQVIVMRVDTDPPMRKGKMIAQGSHASSKFLLNKIADGRGLTEDEEEWVKTGTTKVCLQSTLEDIMTIFANAKKAGLTTHLIQDIGKTEFRGEPTITCLAIGPNQASEIDKLTGHLKLL